MLIIKNMLKKHDINDFYFVRYHDGKDERNSFIVTINDLDAYDLTQKKVIMNLGFLYKKPLTEYVVINEDKISSLKAKRLAKPFYNKFYIFCEEQEDLKHPSDKTRLKHKVYHNQNQHEVS